MKIDSNIKYILFDSGRTLNAPITNDWFFTPNFCRIIQNSNYEISEQKILRSIEKEKSYVDSVMYIPTIEEEFEMFKEYYKRVLIDIEYPYIEDRIISELAYDNVYNDDKVHFFTDVKPALEILKDKYKIGVVSDTWPSLKRIYENNGISECFSNFFITSMLGHKKDDGVLFDTIIDHINLMPEHILFVDGREQYLDIASEYGINTLLINRTRDDIKSNHGVIHSIEELC